MALGNISDRRITRFDDEAAETDALVRYCQEFYDQARTEVLESQPWSFAKRSAALVRRGSVPTIGFSYAQVLPEDMLRLLSLHPGVATPAEETTTPLFGATPEVPVVSASVVPVTYSSRKVDSFEIVGLDVWTNEQFVAAKYIYDSINPTEWSSHVRTAVARRLSALLAGPLTDGTGEVRSQLDLYERVDLPNAQFYDAIQDNSNENSDINSIRAQSSLLGVR